LSFRRYRNLGHAEKDVLELPMPVNNTPEPVLKLLDDLCRVPSVIVAIATQTKGIGMQNFII
jgi:hypothetical protein